MITPDLKLLPLLLLMSVLFGLSFIASQNALQQLGIFQLIFGRYFLALIFLTLIFRKKRQRFYIAKKDWKYFLLLSAVEPIGYFIFETYGIRYTTPSSVSLIITTIPIFSMIFAFWILHEKTTLWGLAGILISIVGVYLIIAGQEISSLAPKPLVGNFLTIGAAASAGFYNAFCRRMTQKYTPTTITYYQTVVATLVFLPFALFENSTNPILSINLFSFLNVAYLAIGCSVVAYLILNYSLKHLQAARVAVFANIIPLVTISASWLFYRELLSESQMIGAGLVVSGVYLTFRRAAQLKTIHPLS